MTLTLNEQGLPTWRHTSSKKPPKIKIEFSDTSGAKYSFQVEGMSKGNMLKLMEFVDSVSSDSSLQDQPKEPQADYTNIDTNFSRVYGLLETKFRFGSFTSSDVLEAYEDHYDLPSNLSTVSTYLSRLAERGLVTRTRNGSGWIYKLIRTNQTMTQSEPQQSEVIVPTEQQTTRDLLTP